MKNPKTVIIIPARYGSTRMPGKPLHLIAGKAMIQRVWELAKQVEGVDEVYIATDDQRIQDYVDGFGAKSVMTPESCKNGTHRALVACGLLDIVPEIVINFQGDSPLVGPQVVQPLVDTMLADPSLQIATPCMQLKGKTYESFLASKANGQAGGTTVTFDKTGKALYFSKSVIPYVRDPEAYKGKEAPIYKHIGLYAYRFETLKAYLELPEGRFEKTESLEQLRALENGIPIQMVEVKNYDRTIASVDSLQDAEEVERILATEGEL